MSIRLRTLRRTRHSTLTDTVRTSQFLANILCKTRYNSWCRPSVIVDERVVPSCESNARFQGIDREPTAEEGTRAWHRNKGCADDASSSLISVK